MKYLLFMLLLSCTAKQEPNKEDLMSRVHAQFALKRTGGDTTILGVVLDNPAKCPIEFSFKIKTPTKEFYQMVTVQYDSSQAYVVLREDHNDPFISIRIQDDPDKAKYQFVNI